MPKNKDKTKVKEKGGGRALKNRKGGKGNNKTETQKGEKG
jgi:hypothetical protein